MTFNSVGIVVDWSPFCLLPLDFNGNISLYTSKHGHAVTGSSFFIISSILFSIFHLEALRCVACLSFSFSLRAPNIQYQVLNRAQSTPGHFGTSPDRQSIQNRRSKKKKSMQLSNNTTQETTTDATIFYCLDFPECHLTPSYYTTRHQTI